MTSNIAPTVSTPANGPASAADPRTPAGSSHAWGRWGGGGVLLGGVLLLAATLVEATPLEPGSASMSLFTVLFLSSTAVHAAAMLPLALGSTGSDGIVGTRTRGKYALLGFGAVFLASQAVYYVAAYGISAGEYGAGYFGVAITLGVFQSVLLLTGAISVVRARVATGVARWALLGLTIVAFATGAIVNASDSAVATTTAYIVSTVAQITVGAIYLRAGSR